MKTHETGARDILVDVAPLGEQIAQAEAEREAIAVVHDTALEWSVAEATQKELDRWDWKINRLKTRLVDAARNTSDADAVVRKDAERVALVALRAKAEQVEATMDLLEHQVGALIDAMTAANAVGSGEVQSQIGAAGLTFKCHLMKKVSRMAGCGVPFTPDNRRFIDHLPMPEGRG